IPSCENSDFALSKEHSEPDGCFSPFSEVSHWASRTFTTNQPSPAGARPEPESSSGASGMRRLYRSAGRQLVCSVRVDYRFGMAGVIETALGDITLQSVDAIVNAANSSLL